MLTQQDEELKEALKSTRVETLPNEGDLTPVNMPTEESKEPAKPQEEAK